MEYRATNIRQEQFQLFDCNYSINLIPSPKILFPNEVTIHRYQRLRLTRVSGGGTIQPAAGGFQWELLSFVS